MIGMEMKRDQKKMVLREAFKDYPGAVRFQEPMAPYTSLKVGGPAEAMVFPRSVSEIAALMERLREYRLPFFVLGGGSNLLVRDGGIAGVVLNLKKLNRVEIHGAEAIAEAGMSYPKLAMEVMGHGLSGLEFAVGIPGTVGGAVAMNAGIPGEETASVLKRITHVDARGEVRILNKEALRLGYRSAALPRGVVASASFHLIPAPVAQIEEKMKGLLKRRRETQPLSFPNVGSVFKNPEGGFAGKWVDGLGLKGDRIGDAQVSERHGNFIVNRGKATARDVLALIKKIGRRVEQERGVTLELEVRIIGKN